MKHDIVISGRILLVARIYTCMYDVFCNDVSVSNAITTILRVDM